MCSREIKESAYKAIVRPHLEYASAAWSPYTQRNINKLEAVQRRSARFVLSDYDYTPTSDLTNKFEKNLKCLTLQDRRYISDIILFFKIKHSLVNVSLPIIVQSSALHANKFRHIQALHSDAYKYSFFVRSVPYWNLVPASILASGAQGVNNLRPNLTTWIEPLQWSKVQNTWTLA